MTIFLAKLLATFGVSTFALWIVFMSVFTSDKFDHQETILNVLKVLMTTLMVCMLITVVVLVWSI